jgi:2,4-dienoyl-CoA reductase-like NADH-dependent reductase (Old Yellow Enzyme family)
MPLFLRISATEWMESSNQPSWDLAQTKQLAALLPDLGVDLLDVSSGGNNPAQTIKVHPYYQVDMAEAIRAEVRAQGKTLAIGAVGMIRDPDMARDVVQAAAADDGTVEVVDGENGQTAKADLVIVGREFLRDPGFVLRTATELGVAVKLPLQYERAPPRKRKL